MSGRWNVCVSGLIILHWYISGSCLFMYPHHKKKEALIPLCMIHLHHITPVYLLDIVKNMNDDSTIPLVSQTT